MSAGQRPGHFPQPAHVAIIMDGNGRWAQMRGLPRQEGHRRGLEALRATVRNAGDLGVRILTLYSFSTENWRRPATEVSFLLGLLKRFVEKDLGELHAAGVRVRIIGGRDDLSPDLRRLVEHAETLTRDNTAMTLVVAFNYGARDEIVRATRRLAADAAAGRIDPAAIDEAMLGSRLDTADLPDPELVIRTSGETRISNFLLWQAAYAEFVFLPVLWPDFDRAAFEEALAEYGRRERRFGGVSEGVDRSVGAA
ncbi:MAG: di-trans,poly-cis-decaprenylcistransferase [Methylobacterium sp.]|jgi:undecaprenyl diphosphate synthase|uniref:isoprenyl transferase n=1 Tax=Bosea sp. (in: a-proteobacteria) TaxID=1871050 RepID=UPI000ADD1E99|nr:isoprenyl transferase [Bosea sp. (in: a-proteobacteria)]MBA4269486.1 di-trans,poly-cis-decaprenylcistransferase [Methylobacterium sp.]MBA4333834.1 di-trans,poly-cis-decaprenylcistransferase [Methylobacterium sp.]WRH58905.1 MAG: isoprenyl transferase [Bosea sp. (in: a-proteobacteria)]